MATNDDYFEGSAPSAVEDGIYAATLVSAEDHEGQYGLRLRWIFELDGTDIDGKPHQVSKFTSRTFSDQSKATEILSALIGHKLDRGELFARKDVIGLPCRLVIGTNDSGWNVIESVKPALKAAA